MSEFINFKEEKPCEGMVTWRSNDSEIPFLFNAKMRWRGAGYEDALSPAFDYWDGYRLNVHHDVSWSRNVLDIGKDEVIPEVEIHACPFCKNTPKVKYSGRYVCAPPMDAKYFYFECCEYINSGYMASRLALKDLVDDWNKSLQGDK